MKDFAIEGSTPVADEGLPVRKTNITGYYGTSATLAEKIEKEGFPPNVQHNGTRGVCFWEDYQRAEQAAITKAKEDKENRYAILTVRLAEAFPHFTGMPKVHSPVKDVTITKIEYNPLNS